MRVAKAAIAARSDQRPLTGAGKIREQRLIIFRENLRSGRHFQNRVFTRGAGSIGAHPVLAVGSLEMLLIAEIDEGVEIVDALNPNAPAMAAIAAIRAAELNEFLAPE